jgi:hypothetical protein
VADPYFLAFSSNALVDCGQGLQQVNVVYGWCVVIGGGKICKMPLSFKPKKTGLSLEMKWRSIKTHRSIFNYTSHTLSNNVAILVFLIVFLL